MKNIIAAVAVVAALAALPKPAQAQFRPCVWPNVCKADFVPGSCTPGALCFR